MISSLLDTTGLLPPQIPHAMRLLDSIYLNGMACDLSETGVGKTYTASWIAKQYNAPIVVICPKSVMPEWNRILSEFKVKPSVMENFEKIMRGNTPYVKYGKPKVDPKTGKTRETARCNLVEVKLPAGCLVIVDESHRCKGVTSLNGGLLIALKRQGYKFLTLSATQATDPTEMRAFGYAANLHDLYNWKKWCINHGAEEVGQWGDITFNNENEESQAKMSLCHSNLFDIQGVASRLTREMMGSLFPDNQVIAESFDLGSNSPKIQAVYDEMEDEIAQLEEQCENYSTHIFAVIMKARRRAEMLKIPLFQEMTEDLFDEGKSVVIFLNFTESITALKERLEKNPKLKGKIGFIYGEQDIKARWRDIKAFQADKLRIMICNLKAGGIAVSLHDLNGKFPRSSLLNPSFSAIDMHQALGRIHRQGGLTFCYQRIVFAAKCIEERACNKVQYRLNNLSCLLDGDLTEGFRIFN